MMIPVMVRRAAVLMAARPAERSPSPCLPGPFAHDGYPQEIPRTMLQALVRTASQLLTDVNRRLVRERPPLPRPSAPPVPTAYQPLQRILLTDGVAHTLFEEYAAHRAEARGAE